MNVSSRTIQLGHIVAHKRKSSNLKDGTGK